MYGQAEPQVAHSPAIESLVSVEENVKRQIVLMAERCFHLIGPDEDEEEDLSGSANNA